MEHDTTDERINQIESTARGPTVGYEYEVIALALCEVARQLARIADRYGLESK